MKCPVSKFQYAGNPVVATSCHVAPASAVLYVTPCCDAHQCVASTKDTSSIADPMGGSATSCQLAPRSDDTYASIRRGPPITITNTPPPGMRAVVVKYSPRWADRAIAFQRTPPS